VIKNMNKKLKRLLVIIFFFIATSPVLMFVGIYPTPTFCQDPLIRSICTYSGDSNPSQVRIPLSCRKILVNECHKVSFFRLSYSAFWYYGDLAFRKISGQPVVGNFGYHMEWIYHQLGFPFRTIIFGTQEYPIYDPRHN
jgi:hypothetical protein